MSMNGWSVHAFVISDYIQFKAAEAICEWSGQGGRSRVLVTGGRSVACEECTHAGGAGGTWCGCNCMHAMRHGRYSLGLV